MTVSVDLRIDGAPADPERFAVPPMSLSSARAGMRPHRFRLTVAVSDLLALVADDYEQLVRELKDDDRVADDRKDELAEAGYPALAEVVTAPAMLQLVIGRYLAADTLAKITWRTGGDIDYWLDEVSECRRNSDRIEFRGTCFSKV